MVLTVWQTVQLILEHTKIVVIQQINGAYCALIQLLIVSHVQILPNALHVGIINILNQIILFV